MSAPTDPAPGEERRGGRHTAARTPLVRRPAVIAGASAVVVLGLVVAGAAALGRSSDDVLAGAPSSTSPGASPGRSVTASASSSATGAGDEATALSAPVPGSASAGSEESATSGSPRPTATAASAEALRELAANPRIEVSAQARQVLASRPVDLRLATLLVQLASQQGLSVAEVPAPASGAEPVRSVVLDRLEGQPVGTDPEAVALVQRQLAAQDPAYRAEATLQQGQDGAAALLVTLPPVTG